MIQGLFVNVIKVAKPIPNTTVFSFPTIIEDVKLYCPGWSIRWLPASNFALISSTVVDSFATKTFSKGIISSLL
jgi:hypothetical protein